MPNTEASEQSQIFPENSWWLKTCLVIMFILAALIRRDEIKAPGHLIEREYNSAIFARAFFFEHNDNIEAWQKENAIATREQLPLLEPPLTEYLVSLIYRALGHEEIWYARYVTAIFWLIGGIFMYMIVKKLQSIDAALVALAYYLFVPWGIIISRSFQPDSLMMMTFLVSLYSMLLYFERPSWKRLLAIGTITGITLLLRPLVMFGLLSAFLVLSIRKEEPGGGLINKRTLVYFVLALGFPVAFYGYGIFIGKFLQAQADLSFRPYLLPRFEFWRGWFENALNVGERAALVSAIFGFFFLRNTARKLVIALSIGYVIFGIVFTFHIHSHPYYHIQLFPIIGICGGAFLSAVGTLVKTWTGRNWWIPMAASTLLALYFSHSAVRSALYTSTFEQPSLSKEIGEVVGHSPRTVFVAYHYGLPLEYYGEFSGLPWPERKDDPFYGRPDAKELSVEERLHGLGYTPEYFVITDFQLYEKYNQDLKEYLEQDCTVLAQKEQYLVYGPCRANTDQYTDKR